MLVAREEAEEAGVEVGNMVTPYSEFEVLTNDKYLTAKAFDNRYGCALAVEVLKRLKDENIGINYTVVPQCKKKLGYVVRKWQRIRLNQIWR